jgi:thiosulfate/3-mercaptopyruvate sulfurtransferase
MRFRVLLSFLVLLFGAATAGAQSTREEMLVTTDWLALHSAEVVLLDIGDRDSFDAGHIAGARLVELTALVTRRDDTPNELPDVARLESVFTAAGIRDKGRIVLYSRDPIFAARAWFTLDYLGHGRRAAILDGGYAKWTAETRPVVTDATVYEPAPFRASVRPEAVTNIKAMRSLVHFREVLGSDLAILDARSPQQFSGEEWGDEISRGGHIPGAVNVPWSDNLTTGLVPRFLPERELREGYTAAGVRRGSTNVVYCRTGMQASVTYFVLKYLGYDASLYDGSFVEWSGSSTLIAARSGAF